MLIVDIHVHPRQKEELKEADNLIRLAAKNGINKICLLGDVLHFGYDPGEEQIKQVNNLTLKLVKKYPETFLGFCFLNPGLKEKFSLREMERCIKEGLKGIKLEVSVNARDKRLDPIMKMAEELNIPLLHHCWYKTVNKTPRESDPSDLADLALRFPKVKIIVAHLSGIGIRGILDIASLANAYVDTSGSQPIAGIVEYGVRHLGAERILFGSDATGRDFSAQLGRILGARIKDREKALILGLNAKRLLHLKE